MPKKEKSDFDHSNTHGNWLCEKFIRFWEASRSNTISDKFIWSQLGLAKGRPFPFLGRERSCVPRSRQTNWHGGMRGNSSHLQIHPSLWALSPWVHFSQPLWVHLFQCVSCTVLWWFSGSGLCKTRCISSQFSCRFNAVVCEGLSSAPVSLRKVSCPSKLQNGKFSVNSCTAGRWWKSNSLSQSCLLFFSQNFLESLVSGLSCRVL